MNVGTFAGRVGADAELKYTQAGKAVASFNIAIDNGKDSEGTKRNATWVKATLWEKKAEALAPHIKKGKVVIVSGPVSVDVWTGKQDGEAQGRIVVTVREFTFGGGGEAEGSTRSEGRTPPAQQTTHGSPISDEDIPF